MTAAGTATASAAHLAGRVAVLEARVRALVERRRADDPDPDDRFRGLYISDAQVDRLLEQGPGVRGIPPAPDGASAALLESVEAAADAAEREGADIRLRRLARSFALLPLDVELLLVVLAPELDPRFESLYAYLNDDISRRRASPGLALDLCGAAPGAGAARARMGAAAPLVRGGLVVVDEPDRPFLTRPLRVPDRVVLHLLGDDEADPLVGAIVAPWVGGGTAQPALEALTAALASPTLLGYVRERPGSGGMSLAATAFDRAGFPPLVLDLRRLDDETGDAAAAAIREARLRGTGLVAGPVEVLAERGPAAVRGFAEAPCPVVLVGTRGWDPGWSNHVPLLLEAVAPVPAEREAMWLAALDGAARGVDGAAVGVDPAVFTAQFRLTPEQVTRAAASARLHASVEGRAVGVADVLSGARAQNSAGLEHLARRVEPRVGWDELVLPPQALEQLHELAARARHRDLVFDAWRMGSGASKGRGITALLAGESGTGKTMAAEVVAGDLGLDLYLIDLSTVIDKYIGETEKNLDLIFVEADRVNGVLLFDEADALFGKRSEVKDSHDRYANVEIAYLLQRMERFEGLAVLTTNLRSNVDEAFTRRLDALVDFPMPEEEDRLVLWRKNLRPTLPTAGGIDLEFLARSFKLSGGNIRNIAVAAAFLAASEGEPVSMPHLIRATEREYRKLGRLCVQAEFGPWFHLVAVGPAAPARPAPTVSAVPQVR